jgi:2,5-diamino-6-(ribosylamino)-4(3H)-pyrimidinone 5'-phosphate reductase
MRPEVTINAAISLDGRLALNTGEQTRLSSEEDMQRVRELRASVDAILVGVGTVLSDDPRLSPNEDVLRVVLDTDGRTPSDALVMRTPPRTLIALGPEASFEAPEGVDARNYPLDGDVIDIDPVLEDLHGLGVSHLLVEGGGRVIWEFLEKGRWDTLQVFIADRIIGGGATALATGEGAYTLDAMVHLEFRECRRMEGGVLMVYGQSSL